MVARPPKEVDILGKTYRIKLEPTMLQVDDCHGKCKPDACQIWIGTDADPQQTRDTVLHEILHGVYSEMGLSEDIKDDLEETIVRRMATGTLYLLRNNPDIIAYLIGD